MTLVKWNTDDTEQEQIINSFYDKRRHVILNCENCNRTTYMNAKIAIARSTADKLLLCPRCRKELTE